MSEAGAGQHAFRVDAIEEDDVEVAPAVEGVGQGQRGVAEGAPRAATGAGARPRRHAHQTQSARQVAHLAPDHRPNHRTSSVRSIFLCFKTAVPGRSCAPRYFPVFSDLNRFYGSYFLLSRDLQRLNLNCRCCTETTWLSSISILIKTHFLKLIYFTLTCKSSIGFLIEMSCFFLLRVRVRVSLGYTGYY